MQCTTQGNSGYTLGDIQRKKTTLPMLDFVQRNLLLLVYFHEEYVENQQRALMTAYSGRHFFL
jgi:hypothetical protein